MGMFGNTTVVERNGTWIEYSRTYSHVKYAPERASIGFVLPEGMQLSDGYLLAEAIVNARLGLLVSEASRCNDLCQQVFNEPLKSFAKQGPLEVRPARRVTRYAIEEDEEVFP